MLPQAARRRPLPNDAGSAAAGFAAADAATAGHALDADLGRDGDGGDAHLDALNKVWRRRGLGRNKVLPGPSWSVRRLKLDRAEAVRAERARHHGGGGKPRGAGGGGFEGGSERQPALRSRGTAGQLPLPLTPPPAAPRASLATVPPPSAHALLSSEVKAVRRILQASREPAVATKVAQWQKQQNWGMPDGRTYAELVRILAWAGEVEHAQELLDEVRAAGADIDSDTQFLLQAAYVKAGRYGDLLQAYAAIAFRTGAGLAADIGECLSKEGEDAANSFHWRSSTGEEDAHRDLLGSSRSRATYLLTMWVLRELGQDAAAERGLRALLDSNWMPTPAELCAIRRMHRQAGLVDKMDGFVLDVHRRGFYKKEAVYRDLVLSLYRSGQLACAQREARSLLALKVCLANGACSQAVSKGY
eukprot:SM000085S23282  [mRNA]  locus=s85:385948:387502:+ [translate_table: standard]